MEEKYSIRYFTNPKSNIAGYRHSVLIRYKKKIIIGCILFGIFIAFTIYDAFYPLNGIGKVLCGIVLVIPAAYLFMFRSDFEMARIDFEKIGSNECTLHIYNDSIQVERMKGDAEFPIISLSDNTLKVINRKKYFFLISFLSKCYFTIPKESLSEADKNALAELTENIKNMPRGDLKAAERSGQ